MQVLYRFAPPGFTYEQYDKIVQLMDDAGWGSPEGRRYHVCYGESGALQVVDVWDSEQHLRAFYEALFPILHKVGVEATEPFYGQVHNIIEG
ncbi:hypothetical protein [Actinopolymorpha pittospori]|uniref:ABM domain-containing protein n=1 Tax=Actinopolymorpha pittospori TaxID=648752 RepID=A0A927MQ14_9ACTN|nr:hypothetical protein [Actinopolymorpha pittospori]MBE1604569.1 hypothetical protein [Actinopolymorpha pittospori]